MSGEEQLYTRVLLSRNICLTQLKPRPLLIGNISNIIFFASFAQRELIRFLVNMINFVISHFLRPIIKYK